MTRKKKNMLILFIGILFVLVVLTLLLTRKFFNKKHEFYCDKFLLTVDEKQLNLKEIDAGLSSVSELLLIDKDHLFIMGRVNENENALMIYDFIKQAIIFNERGTTLCFTNNDVTTCRYLVGDTVYSLKGEQIYSADVESHIVMIEYVEEYFKITLTDLQYENEKEVWLS